MKTYSLNHVFSLDISIWSFYNPFNKLRIRETENVPCISSSSAVSNVRAKCCEKCPFLKTRACFFNRPPQFPRPPLKTRLWFGLSTTMGTVERLSGKDWAKWAQSHHEGRRCHPWTPVFPMPAVGSFSATPRPLSSPRDLF